MHLHCRNMQRMFQCARRQTSARNNRRICTFAAAYLRGESSSKGGVVKNALTKATPRLTPEKVFERLFEVASDTAREHYKAFYSSLLGGIVTEPALMTIHYDDEVLQSGYAIEEVVRLMNGYVYNLERASERIMESADVVGLGLGTSSAALLRVILDSAAASKLMDGYIRIWVTGGRHGASPSVYVLVHNEEINVDRTMGLSVITSNVPPPPVASVPLVASAGHIVCKLEAAAEGANLGIFVDEEGYILHAPGASVGIITQELQMVTPPSTDVLPALTMERLMEICPQCDEEAMDVTFAVQRPIHVSEVHSALEVFVTSTALGVVGVVSWDGRDIGDGTPGTNTLAMQGLLNYEYENSGSELHYEVPYGYLTGMRQQLR